LKLTEVTVMGGTTVAFPVTVVEPVVAVIITGVELVTDPAVKVNVTPFCPARTVTDAGVAGSAAELLLARPTMIFAAAVPVRVTVPVVDCPLTMLLGLKLSCATTGGLIVRVAVWGLPASEAEIVTIAWLATGIVVIVNGALVLLPAGTMALPVHPPDSMAGPGQGLKLTGTTIPPTGAA